MRKILPTIILCFIALCANGADIQRLSHDTMRFSQNASRITMAWWIPTEFWDAALKADATVSEIMRKQICEALDGYTVFAVMVADIGPFGGFFPKERPALVANCALTYNGSSIALLDKDDISPDALNFVVMMKPLMGNMLGQFGQGMEFLIYPNPAKKGGVKIRATQKGNLSYSLFGEKLEWRLPLGSLLPLKIDPKTKETFPGDYLYSPYTGEKLIDK